MTAAVRRTIMVCTLFALLSLLAGGATAVSTSAATLYVDQASPSCSNSGPGSQTQPFCTISASVPVATPGTTVQVAAGTYAEQVSPHTGASGSPVVFSAAPGATVTVTGKSYGFYLSNLSWVTINGFSVTGTTNQGIYVTSSSSVTISGNHVTLAGHPTSGQTKSGIYLTNTSSSLVSGNTTDHNSDAGIQLSTGSTGDEVRGNVTFQNAQVWQRQAAGIRLYKSPGNIVDGNITHDNEDSGIESFNGSNNTLIYDNVSFRNGDHGIDNYGSTGQRIISNTVYKDVTAGINVEGTSPGATVENNVSVDNGINSPRTRSDIRIERGSTAGTTVDYNLVYLTTPDTLLIWDSAFYTSLAAYQAASGQMAHGVVADPRWSNPVAGDFHLTAGSPAIDSANSGVSGQPALDVTGLPRVDDTKTPDTGAGPRTYDDRGAYEFQPPDYAPSALLKLTPKSGPAPLSVTADASASSDPDPTPIASYTFDFGDGSAAVGPQAGAAAHHIYTKAGTYTVKVTVTDTAGLSSSTTATATVGDGPPAVVLTVTPSSGSAPLAVTADASASTDGDATPIATYKFDFGDGSPVVGPQVGATATHTFTVGGAYNVTVTVTDTAGNSSNSTKVVSVAAGADQPPSASLAVSPPSGPMPLAVTADASASTDPDSTPIATYRFDFGDGSASVGPQAGATASHTYTSAGTHTVKVTVTDTGGLTASATSTVTVSDSPPVSTLLLTPSSGPAPLAVIADASASTDTDGTPIATYAFDFGDGSAVVGPQQASSSSHVYATAGTYTVTVTVTDTAGGSSQATRQVMVGAGVVGNPGFESDTSGWNTSGSATGVTLTRVSGGHSGGFAAALANTSPSSGACTLNDAPNWVATTAAGTYTTSMWARADSPGATLNLRVREYAGSALIGTGTNHLTLTTAWQQLSVAYAPRSVGSSTLDVNAYVSNAPPGNCYYADDIAIVLGSPDSPPTPALAVTPAGGNAPLPVVADASGSTDTDAAPIATYTFNFGDGSPTVGPQAAATASHTFTAAGTYTVTITVTDTLGLSAQTTRQVTVAAGDAPPTAALTVTPAAGTAPLPVTANASGSMDTDATPISTYSFDFGDGSAVVGPQAGATATHTYAAAGTYTVTVTVADTGGLSSNATKQVSVSGTGPPNLVGNPGFEAATSGWNTSGSGTGVTLTRVAGGHSGGWSAQLTNTTTANSGLTLNDSPNWVAATGAGTYTASLWVRADNPGATLTLRLREYVGSTQTGTASASLVLTAAWQQVTVSYVPLSPGSSTLDLNAFVGTAASPPGASFYADDASITLG